MRDLLEKALNKGLTVSFTSENGFDVIRISSGNDVVASCSLGTTSFRASVEESLQALLLDLERKGFQMHEVHDSFPKAYNLIPVTLKQKAPDWGLLLLYLLYTL